MKITEIKPQKNRANRFNIYVDDEYSFAVTGDFLSDHYKEIKLGQSISQNQIDKYIEESEPDLVFQYICYQIGFGPKTEKKMIEKLKTKKFKEESIQIGMEKAKKIGLINDIEYFSDYIEVLKNKKMGLRKIKNKLYNKGFPSTLIDNNLGEIYDDETLIKNAMEKGLNRKERIKEPGIYKKKRKICSYLYSQGYDNDTISLVINEIFRDECDSEK